MAMQKTVNGKKIKITDAGYLYINGKKQSERACTPFQIPTKDPDARKVCREYIKRNYRMA